MLARCIYIESFQNPTQKAQEKKAGIRDGEIDRFCICKVPGVDSFLSEVWFKFRNIARTHFWIWLLLSWVLSPLCMMSSQHPCQRKGQSNKNLTSLIGSQWAYTGHVAYSEPTSGQHLSPARVPTGNLLDYKCGGRVASSKPKQGMAASKKREWMLDG